MGRITEEDVLQALEKRNQEQLARTRKLLYSEGRPLERRGLKTVRNLIARELLACDGGAFDPEKRLVITERGRFVLKWGSSGV